MVQLGLDRNGEMGVCDISVGGDGLYAHGRRKDAGLLSHRLGDTEPFQGDPGPLDPGLEVVETVGVGVGLGNVVVAAGGRPSCPVTMTTVGAYQRKIVCFCAPAEGILLLPATEPRRSSPRGRSARCRRDRDSTKIRAHRRTTEAFFGR